MKQFGIYIVVVATGITCLSTLLLIERLFVQGRVMSTDRMRPALSRGDRTFFEKLSTLLKYPHQHGEIVAYYINDISPDPRYVLGRLTGLPIFPQEPVFAFRVIGVPGDEVSFVGGTGIVLNGQNVVESEYGNEAEPPITIFREQGSNKLVKLGQVRTIRVPVGNVLVLADNVRNDEDTRLFSLVREERVAGRCWFRWNPSFKLFTPQATKGGDLSETEKAMELAGFAAAHAVYSVSDGEQLIPFIMTESSKGQKIDRLVANTSDESIKIGEKWLDENTLQATKAVLAFNALAKVNGIERDALMLHVREYRGNLEYADIVIAIPVKQKGAKQNFVVYDPVIDGIQNRADRDLLIDAFVRGAESHTNAAKVWASHKDKT